MPAKPANQNKSKRLKHGEWREALRCAVQAYESKDIRRGTALKHIGRKLVSMALDGNLEAIKELGNRLDGRTGMLEMGDEPIQISGIRREIIVIDRQTTPENQPIEGELVSEPLPKPADSAVQKG